VFHSDSKTQIHGMLESDGSGIRKGVKIQTTEF